MILSFNIEYRTNWGEEVRISGLFPESIPLHTTDGIYWTAELELEVPQEGMTINYSYQIEQNGIVIRKEWDSFSRSIFLSGSSRKIYRINDCWKNIPEQLYLYSSAFTEALLAHPEKENIPQRYKKGLVIKAYAPRINKDYCLAICGNQKSLGHWDPEKAVLMSDTNFPEWQIELDASKLKYPLEYKFILYNKQEKKADCWEKTHQPLSGRSGTENQRNARDFRPICLFRHPRMERGRNRYTRIFFKIREKFRSR